MLAILVLISLYDAYGLSRVPSFDLSKPELKSVDSPPLCAVTIGQQLVITTVAWNDDDKDQEFAAILEVRDSDGVTEYLAWQSGTLKVSGQTEVGVMWTPARAGDYELRAFAISGFDDPQVLSAVASSQIDIASQDDLDSC